MKKMKKVLAIILMLAMVLSLAACGGSKPAQTPEPAPAEEPKILKIGVLTMLGTTEEEMVSYFNAVVLATRAIAAEGKVNDVMENNKQEMPEEVPTEIVFYDSLDAMLMALNAGDINTMCIYNTTADYLVANNDKLVKGMSYDFDPESKDFTSMILTGVLANSFSFMMMEGREDLRDEFNAAIISMQDDDTLGKLIKEQMRDIVDGKQIETIEMPVIEGAETIKVAITGSLPPMDYVAADGAAAGYNTAVLAEISRRIGKNIELVVVDSVGRAAALASGTVDAVFWTRSSDIGNKVASIQDDKYEELLEKRISEFSDQEKEAIAKIEENFDMREYGTKDMPEGTIITESYFRDVIVPVMTKDFLESMPK